MVINIDKNGNVIPDLSKVKLTRENFPELFVLLENMEIKEG